jgi:hypothetical protein
MGEFLALFSHSVLVSCCHYCAQNVQFIRLECEKFKNNSVCLSLHSSVPLENRHVTVTDRTVLLTRFFRIGSNLEMISMKLRKLPRHAVLSCHRYVSLFVARDERDGQDKRRSVILLYINRKFWRDTLNVYICGNCAVFDAKWRIARLR